LISSDLFDIIMAHGSTTRKIWKAIANLFHDNKKSHSLALDAEFCNTPRGDMSVDDYCTNLKSRQPDHHRREPRLHGARRP
jgi:hypothetical protein